MTEEMVYKAFYGMFTDAYDFFSDPTDHNVNSYVLGIYDMASAILEKIYEERKKTEANNGSQERYCKSD